MRANPWAEWTIEPPIDFEVGKTYIVRANHDDTGLWADLLITITECTEQGDFGFEVETMLDGSPKMMEGWMGRTEAQEP